MSRQYDSVYKLTTPAGVKRLLRDRHDIAERRYKGDTDASDILLDLYDAIDSAGLSDQQALAIAVVYGQAQLTQEEAAEILSVQQQNIARYVNEAARKIARVYRKWEEDTEWRWLGDKGDSNSI